MHSPGRAAAAGPEREGGGGAGAVLAPSPHNAQVWASHRAGAWTPAPTSRGPSSLSEGAAASNLGLSLGDRERGPPGEGRGLPSAAGPAMTSPRRLAGENKMRLLPILTPPLKTSQADSRFKCGKMKP